MEKRTVFGYWRTGKLFFHNLFNENPKLSQVNRKCDINEQTFWRNRVKVWATANVDIRVFKKK